MHSVTLKYCPKDGWEIGISEWDYHKSKTEADIKPGYHILLYTGHSKTGSQFEFLCVIPNTIALLLIDDLCQYFLFLTCEIVVNVSQATNSSLKVREKPSPPIFSEEESMAKQTGGSG